MIDNHLLDLDRPMLVSACLMGRPTRYDGRLSPNLELVELLRGRNFLAVCPEQLGGLATPRTPADIVGGDGRDVLAGRARVVDREGRDVTGPFVRGAEVVLDVARRLGVRRCFLKDRSPSCGVHPFCSGDVNRPAPGVLAALLRESGLELIEIKAHSQKGL